MKKKLLFFCLLLCIWQHIVRAQEFYHPENAVYQYTVNLGSKRAYLWIPSQCKQVKGIILSFANLLERNWLEDPIIRKCAAKNNLAVVLMEASADGVTADLKGNAPVIFLKMLKDMAKKSGYAEIEYAPFIPIDHSVYGVFTWTLPALFPGRTLATMPVKTFALPIDLGFTGIPVCYIVGENDEWPPANDGKEWSRDLVWPLITHSAVELRNSNKQNLVSVVTDPGGGHLDWSDRLSTFMALFIDKACKYRLPEKPTRNATPKLKQIDLQAGWLTDTTGLKPVNFKPSAYKNYKGYPQNAYWFLDEEMARATSAFAGDKLKHQIQMLTFVQNGQPLPLANKGFVMMQFQPEQDGTTFNIKGDFLYTVPEGLIGAGSALGHSDGAIRFRVITGPAIQTSTTQFRIQFNRSTPGGDVWIQEEQAGDDNYKHAVQPGQIKIPAILTEGKAQKISFAKIPDQRTGISSVKLSATADSGLPVSYYVIAGPAIITGDTLTFTPIPIKSKYPIEITVVAYQWGRPIEPFYQSAASVTQTFKLLR